MHRMPAPASAPTPLLQLCRPLTPTDTRRAHCSMTDGRTTLYPKSSRYLSTPIAPNADYTSDEITKFDDIL